MSSEALWKARLPWLVLLALALALGLAARLNAALTDLGVYWPDEVYQSLEPAHGLVFGTALWPWEFIAGARNWLLPGLIAGVFWTAKALGVTDPHTSLLAVRVLFVVVSIGTVLGTSRLCRALGLPLPAAVMAAVAMSCMSLGVYFSARALSEVAAALPLTWGLALTLETGARWRLVVGASLLGLAALFRMHCGLFAAGAVVTLLLAGRRREAAISFGVLGGWALASGLLDLVTWGRFLHSTLLYVRFNLLEGRSSEFGVAPPAFYTKHLTWSLGALWVALALLALLGARRAAVVFVPALLFFGVHFVTPHKELRFLIPMLPLVCVAAAAGLEVLKQRRTAFALAAAAVVVLASGYSLATHRRLTFRDVGFVGRPGSAWDSGGPVTRLLFLAGRQERLCGVGLTGWDRSMTFAYTALHRDVPFYTQPFPSLTSGFIDLIIAPAGSEPGTVLARDGAFELVRVFDGPCARDPDFTPYLDERTARVAKDPEAW